MATQVQFRGGTTTEHASFNGAAREVTVDTTKQTLVVQDGSTNGGFPLLREKNPDNQKVYFGTGDDLQIYHNGDSFLTNTTATQFAIQSDNLRLRSTTDNENYIVCTDEAGVELYWDGTKKLGTTSDGVMLPDSQSLTLGDDGDVKLKHQSGHFEVNNIAGNTYFQSNGSFNLRGKHSGSTETMLIGNVGGAVELYYDNSKKLNTTSTGVEVTGRIDILGTGTRIDIATDGKIILGDSNELQIYYDGTYSRIQDSSTNFVFDANRFTINKPGSPVENIFDANSNGAVTLYYDDSAKFKTTADGVEITGDAKFDGATAGRDATWDRSADALVFESYAQIQLKDQASIRCGSDEDLVIYHDGAHGYINNETGDLKFQMPGGLQTSIQSAGVLSVYGNASNDYIIHCHNDGANTDRHGLRIYCGSDDATGTNYAISIGDGNGTNQGFVTFTGGTVTYGTFTAYHPCIVPDSENPSDSSNAYPYGTLLETISIEYTQKNGANTERGIRYKVQKTQSANSRKVLGAYGSSMNGGPEGQTNEHQALVLGDGHILVNNAGGNIEVGDGICSSATAGIGQKATANPSMIIGIAQEAVAFTGSETKLVAVQYGLQQFIPWS